jgi:hypothetical protein
MSLLKLISAVVVATVLAFLVHFIMDNFNLEAMLVSLCVAMIVVAIGIGGSHA